MNIVLRLAAACGLAGLALANPVYAQGVEDLSTVSVTGSYLAGQQALQELRTKDAVAFFRDAVASQYDSPQILGRAFMAYAANGDVEAAADAAEHLLTLDSTDEMAHLVIATQALKQRRYDAAIAQLDQLSTDSFAGATGAIVKAWALTGEGRIDDGLKILDGLGGSLANFLTLHRAIMEDVAGRSADALALTATAYAANPYAPDLVEAYARMLGNAGRFDEAIDVVVNFEAQGLDHPSVTALKSVLANKQRPGLYADSVQAGAAQMYHAVGLAFARQSRDDVAMLFFRLAQYLDPRQDEVTIVIGQLYDAAGQHDAANAIYNTIPDASPMKPMAVVQVASNLDALGDRPEAIRQLGNIVTADPADLNAVFALGNLLRDDKQYQASADIYSKAIVATASGTQTDWRLFYYRGMAYERGKQWPLAEPDFQHALQLAPDQPDVLNYLGYSWVDQGVHLAEGLDMIQKAIDARPKDGYIIDSLGWAYYHLGRYDNAVTQLEQAATLLPTDPTINDHLGDAYWRAGRKLEARFQWNVVASVDTDGDVRPVALAKLKDGLANLTNADWNKTSKLMAPN